MANDMFKQKFIPWFILTCISIVALWYVWDILLYTPIFLPDEVDIIDPAIQHITNKTAYPVEKYPAFPFIVYETLICISQHFSSHVSYLKVARLGTFFFVILGMFLMYSAAIPYVGKKWAMIASLAFLTSPVVTYASVIVKTESLILCETVVVLICLTKIWHNPNQSTWHYGCAIFCGLATATKYHIHLSFVYMMLLFAMTFLHSSHIKKLSLSTSIKKLVIFSLIFMVTIGLSWPDVYQWIGLPKNRLPEDLYFNSNPSAFRAIDEPFSFPYGQYSYAIFYIIPYAVGILTFVSGIVSILCRILPLSFLIVWGIPTLIYLGISQYVTLIRAHHIFTPCVPFFVIAATVLWKHVMTVKIKTKWIQVPGLICIMGILVYQFEPYSMHHQYMDVIRSIPDSESKQCLYLINSVTSHFSGIDASHIEETVFQKKEPYLLVLDSYFYNFCKYKTSETYQKQCNFFHRLISGQTSYILEWKQRIQFRFQSLNTDPEASYTFYYFIDQSQTNNPTLRQVEKM